MYGGADVGGIRGRRTTILDAFHLKSYEGIARLPDEAGCARSPYIFVCVLRGAVGYICALMCSCCWSDEDQHDVVAKAKLKGFTRYALVPCGRGRARGGDIGHHKKGDVSAERLEARESERATCVVERDLRDGYVILGAWHKTNPVMRRAAQIIAGFKRRKSPQAYLKRWYAALGTRPPTIATCPLASLTGGNSTIELRALLPAILEATDGVTLLASPGDMRKPWDVIVRHLGWRMDRAPLAAGGINVTMLDMREAKVYTDGQGSYKVDKSQKARRGEPLSSVRQSRYRGYYPRLDSKWQSTNTPHLFFAGAASHGSDRYRYAGPGGFIHGYRFTARALWRALELTYHNEDWASVPDSTVAGPITTGVTKFPWVFHYKRQAAQLGYQKLASARPLWGKLLQRLNSAPGPYAMHGGSLCDVIVFEHNTTQNEDGEYATVHGSARYYVDMPEDLAHERFRDRPRLVMMYAFGPAAFFAPWGTVAASFTPQAPIAIDKTYSPFVSVFHPVLEYWAPGHVPPPHDPEWFNRQEGASDGSHPPIARWSPHRMSSRYHVQGGARCVDSALCLKDFNCD